MWASSNIFVLILSILWAHIEIITAAPAITGPPDALVTARAVLEKRTVSYNDPRFIGWQGESNTVVQWTCNSGFTYSASPPYWACCASGVSACNIPTSCVAGTSAKDKLVETCGASSSCISGLLYYSINDYFPWTYLACGSGINNFFAVRTTVTAGLVTFTPFGFVATPTAVATTSSSSKASSSTSSTSSSSKASSSTSSTPSSSTSLSLSTTTITVSNPSSTTGSSTTLTLTSPTPSQTDPVVIKTVSLGPIIGGAVGGSLIAIGLISMGIFFCLAARKKKRDEVITPTVVAPVLPPPDKYAPTSPQISELHSPISQFVPSPPTSPPPGPQWGAPTAGQVSYYNTPNPGPPVYVAYHNERQDVAVVESGGKQVFNSPPPQMVPERHFHEVQGSEVAR